VSFAVLLRKEFKEIVRTKRIIVLPAVFLFFGILGPVLLYMTPELLKSQGLNFTMPAPTPVQSAGEYYESASSFAAIAIILVSMGAVVEEKARGTIQIVLTKPARRSCFIAAKYIALACLSLVSMFMGSVACLYYTGLLIGHLPIGPYMISTMLVGLFLCFVVALTLFFSTVLGSQMAAGGATIVVFFLLGALPIASKALRTMLPNGLVGLGNAVLAGESPTLLAPVVADLVLIVLILIAAWAIFSRQEL